MQLESSRQWAIRVFGHAQLGDRRRTERLIQIAAQVARQPSGKVSEVVSNEAELQGAYDFLESRHVGSEAVIDAMADAAFALAKRCSFVYAAVDGSSLTLTDTARAKDFGSVGTANCGARGLKVLDSLLVSPHGEALGMASLQWWQRIVRKRVSAKQGRTRRIKLPVSEKETRYWLDAISVTQRRADEHGVRVWFQLDREADNQDLLWHLAHSGHQYTVRSSWNRTVLGSDQRRCYLRDQLQHQTPLGSYPLQVAAGPHRSARRATMSVRVARVAVILRNKVDGAKRILALTAVLAREISLVPAGEKPLEWLLLTNTSVASFTDAQQVIYGYAQRWRIEEFHKTWKTGACNVERTQLHSARAVKLWASILASVANRIERLKHLSRNQPELPASAELTTYEIRALLRLRRQIQHRAEIALDAMPTIAQATLWIAQLGGYTGKSSGGPPGSITIRRGLERLRPAALLLEGLENDLQ